MKKRSGKTIPSKAWLLGKQRLETRGKQIQAFASEPFLAQNHKSPGARWPPWIPSPGFAWQQTASPPARSASLRLWRPKHVRTVPAQEISRLLFWGVPRFLIGKLNSDGLQPRSKLYSVLIMEGLLKKYDCFLVSDIRH